MPEHYEFEVELSGVKPRIWRRFLLPKTATFMDLHRAIQDACGWLDGHLFRFFQKNPYRDAIAGIPEEGEFGEPPDPDASKKKLSSYFGTGRGARKTCGYLYDFGDDWVHKVRIVGTSDLPGKPRRVLTGGGRAFPPEDCGSLDGYRRCARFVLTGRDAFGEGNILGRQLGSWHPDGFDFGAVKKKFDGDLPVRAGSETEPDGAVPSAEDVLGMLDASPFEQMLAGIVAVAMAGGKTAPWTSILSCCEPLGRNDCKGLLQVWLQEVPRAVRWRCTACGAAGTITSLAGGAMELPEFSVRRPDDKLVRVSFAPGDFMEFNTCEMLPDEAREVLLSASYEDGRNIVEATHTGMRLLLAGVVVEQEYASSRRREKLASLTEQIGRALDEWEGASGGT